MTCVVCGHQGSHQTEASRTFRVGDKVVVVEGIPAEVCDRCGEPSFDAAVAEQVRRLVHGPHKPERVISAEVVRFHAA